MALRVRLRPKVAIGCHVGLLLFIVVGALVGFTEVGLMPAAFQLLWFACLPMWALTWRVTLPARHRLPPGDVTRIDGSRTVAGLLLAVSVLGWPACLLMGLAVLLSPPGTFTRPGLAVSAAIGALIMLPAWFRLLTGRLQLWRFELDPDVLRWVALRRTTEIEWAEIRVLELREHGTQLWIEKHDAAEPLRLPLLGFDYPGEEILEALERKRLARRR